MNTTVLKPGDVILFHRPDGEVLSDAGYRVDVAEQVRVVAEDGSYFVSATYVEYTGVEDGIAYGSEILAVNDPSISLK